MLDSVRGRLLGLFVLAVVLAVLPVWFGSLAPAPYLGDYANGGELDRNYEAFVGQEVYVGGHVVETDPVILETEDGANERIRFEVVGVSEPVEPGASLRVFGVARAGRVIEATRTVVVPPSGYLWAFGVSVLAGLWVLARVIRDWRFDRDALGLRPGREHRQGEIDA